MAIHERTILQQVQPGSSGDVFPQPYSVLATNDVWKHIIFRFGADNTIEPTVREGLFGTFTVPQNYVSGAELVIIWTATLITGDVVWDFDYRAVGGDDLESLDQAGTQEAVTVTDTAPSAAHERMRVTVLLTDANFAAGDTVEFFLARDGAAAADTLAGSAILFDALFRYSDA